MSELKRLAVDHPYYCSESNFYSNDAATEWATMTDFLDDFEDADIDMNLCFRWDIRPVDEDYPDGPYRAEVFLMLQRKGVFAPHRIAKITEEEAPRFMAYAERHWQMLTTMWQPISEDQQP